MSESPAIPGGGLGGRNRSSTIASMRARLSALLAYGDAVGRQRACDVVQLSDADWERATPLALQGICGEVRLHHDPKRSLILKRAASHRYTRALLNELNMHVWLWERFPPKDVHLISQPVRIADDFMSVLTTAQVFVPNATQLCDSAETMTEAIAFKVAGQVATAWHTMHSLGVAHLDAHGGNVLYDNANSHIVVIDFGYTRFLRDVQAFKQTFHPTTRFHDNLLFAREGEGSDTMHYMYGEHDGRLRTTRTHYRVIVAQAAQARKESILKIKLALTASAFALLYSVRTMCDL